MATISQASGYLFNASLSGGLNQRDLDYLASRIEEKTSRLGRVGEDLRNKAMEIHGRYNLTSIQRGLKSIYRKMENSFSRSEGIYDLPDIGAFQHANRDTIRFLMANPELRRMAKLERCEGYQDLYFDEEPDAIGHTHSDYQRVMQGMPVIDGEDLNHVTYLNVQHEEPMDVEDQGAIIRNWSLQNYFQSLGEDDSSSPSNASL